MDVDKGRENCRKYVEERKLLRVAKETRMTTNEVVEGISTGKLGVDNSASGEAQVVVESLKGL